MNTITLRSSVDIFFSFWLYSPIQALVASLKLSVSLQLLDVEQSVGPLGRVISSSQFCTQTQKNMHKQHKH
jgi:hypothetical protein